MDVWRERLAGVDDEYLIGLSNKGIVKRAYKDKEEIPAEIGAAGEEATVKINEETVTVRYPLGESRCTCPSRSICRHVVQAILVLRENCLREGTEADTCLQEETEAEASVREEINAYPLSRLKKALGSRYFQSFVNQAAAGIRPAIQYSTVITVQLPEQEMIVKLLFPLEYSSCTCRKKELCRHKAAAILWCQMEAGIVTGEMLAREAGEAPALDREEIREAAGQMRAFLEELFVTGLSRVSPDVLNYLERLAIISHNAELARFEGYFRGLSNVYDSYFARKAAFRTEELTGRLTRLYRRIMLLDQAEDAGAVMKLAGEFRADYLPVGNLDLIGIAMEHFRSRNGYEGETVYFLEENTKKWYTYTNVRPVFYDTSRKRGYAEKSQAPWGLNVSLENLLKVRIHLAGARCDGRNRLSSSQETRGEITGEQGLRLSDIREWYYRDFGKLFQEQIGRQQQEWLGEQGVSDEEGKYGEGTERSAEGAELVIVRPDSCAKAEFSRTGQQLTLPLYDRAGREILVEVEYSREEAGTIRYLERVSERKLPCFLGKITLREGRLRMYPVDLLNIEEDDDTEETVKTEERIRIEETVQEDAEEQGPARGSEGILAGHRPGFLVVEDLTEEVLSLMEELCQSGFGAVHDSTLEGIRQAGELTAQYGMRYLSELLTALGEKIETNRHLMKREAAPMAELYAEIEEYLYLCRQKNAYNRGENAYLNQLTGAQRL